MQSMLMKISSSAYYPMLTPTNRLDSDEMDLWSKYDALPDEKKDILTSHEMPLKIKELQDTFQIKEESVAIVSYMVRKIFFGEVDFSAAESKLVSMCSGSIDAAKAREIVVFIQTEILTIKPVKEIEPEEDFSGPRPATVKLPLLKAMSEYKHVADQIITSEKIKLRHSQELVRPTLSNWIRSYREELGIGFHEPVQRGNFLFQTVNGRKLTNEDRAKLNLILKSIEEGFPLDIDPKKEEIVFPAGSDTSMELTQVNTNARPVANRFIQPRAMPVGTVRPATFAPGMAPAALKPGMGPAPQKPSPAAPVLANLKPLFSKAASPEKNISGETLHFSTGHVLPAEKVAEKSKPVPVAAAPVAAGSPIAQPGQPLNQGMRREPGAGLPKSTYTIRPLRLRNEDQSGA